MKNLIFYLWGNKSIIFCLLALFIISSLLSHFNIFNIRDFWVNLSAGIAGSLITITVIDFLQTQRRKLKFKDADKIVAKELNDLSKIIIIWIASRFNIRFLDYYKGDQYSAVENVYNIFVKTDIYSLMRRFTYDEWNFLLTYIIQNKSSLEESVLVYKDHISGNLLGSLLKLRADYKNMYITFGYMHTGWIIDKKMPLKELITKFTDELRTVLKSAHSLMRDTHYEK